MFHSNPCDRLFSRIAIHPGLGISSCWEWLGSRNPKGYGRFRARPIRSRGAHRVAYLLLRGPIPSGLELDHLCRNRACVNPWHMEAVTHRVNLLRGQPPHGCIQNLSTIGFAWRASLTHCKRGHPFSPANTRRKTDGSRRCLACARIHTDTYNARSIA